MKMKVRGLQTKTSCKDGLGCILKSFGCTGDAEFASMQMHFDYEVSPVRFHHFIISSHLKICREKRR